MKNGINYTVQRWLDKVDGSSKDFMASQLGLTGTEISINRFKKGQGYPFVHAHREHEEVYYIISGTGICHIDGEEFEVPEGSFIRISPEGKRALRANDDGDIVFMCIQAKAGSISKQTMKDGYLIDRVYASWHTPS